MERLRILPEILTIYVYISGPVDHNTMNVDCNSNRNQMSGTSSIQTKRNRKQYCTVKLIKYVRQVTFLMLKHLWVAIRGNLRISGVWHVGWWHLITSVRLIQAGNNRNDHFRYFLGVRGPFNRDARLIKVLFKVNKGNKFGDFGYCPLNRGCPLNTVSAQYRFHCSFM